MNYVKIFATSRHMTPCGFFCFRFVFSFRPVAAGGAGRGSKGQAPPFGESYAYGQPR